ncbi:MAG TPA: metalloregulator ArsR/SmtB family transcription factor [Tepidisphaeraceae bacterium]|nr:metalloregulator ArsR/SmtB family transcription factor [Tepidisphaeraceae bacterium]
MSDDEDDSFSLVLGALANPTRRAIVEQLLDTSCAVSELKLPRKISASTLSKHLTVLAEAGLLTQHASGRKRICRVQKVPLKQLGSWLETHRRSIYSQRASLERFFGVNP